MDSYANVLESYLIPAEEGLMDKIKGAGSKALEGLKKLVNWLKEKVVALFRKLKGAKTYKMDELIKERDRLKKDKEELEDNLRQAEADAARQYNESTRYHNSYHMMKMGINLSGKLAACISNVNREIIKIYNELPRLYKLTSNKMEDFSDRWDFKRQLDDIRVNVRTDNLTISNKFKGELRSTISDIFDASEDELRVTYISNEVKINAEKCLENINKLLDTMEKLTESLDKYKFGANQQAEYLATTFNIVVSACNKSVKDLSEVQVQIARICTANVRFIQ